MHKRLAACLLSACLAQPLAAAALFPRDFAPSEGWLQPQEAPYRGEICLNGAWQFQPVPVPEGWARDTGAPPELPPPRDDRWERTPIKIPSPWNVNAWGNGRRVGPGTEHPYRPDSVYYPSYPEAWDHAEMGWLRRVFRVPAGWEGRRIVLRFEAVAGDCRVLVNGGKAAEHFDRFLPFEADVTPLVRFDGDNELLVGVRHHRLFNKRSARYPHYRTPYPPGSELERIAGIWQDVHLLGLPAVRVQDAFVQPLLDRGALRVEVTVRNDGREPREIAVAGSVHPWVNLAGDSVLDAPEPTWKLADPVVNVAAVRARVEPGATVALTLAQAVRDELRPWSPDAPNLHALVLSVGAGGEVVDRRCIRFGWRQFALRGRDVLLNGQRLQMFGDLSHPFGPFMMSRRFVWAWYRMIKDFGGNAVRPHAQPYPRAYLDLADEMGIVVLDETALFGSSLQLNFEDPAAWERFAAHYDALVLRDRNHPSVIGWSFGNELFAIFSYNRIPEEEAAGLYGRLAELGLRARRLDPTREWISCDGDEDLRGALPVWSVHLGHGLHAIADVPKPRMVGESGGTYYATPKQLSVFNGDRAYASYAGRNEALAIDLYRNVAALARPQLAYFSPSEMVWFGIEHLPLGFTEFARLPALRDGVFFKAFREGKPGMQPERLPPYVTTLNPGYDPALPLYKPLAMFEAMRAALAPAGPAPCAWDRAPEKKEPAAGPPPPDVTGVAFAGDRGGICHRKLSAWGVPLFSGGDAEDARMLIIDGEALSEATDALVRQAEAVCARGGAVLIMVRQRPASVEALDRLLPARLEVTAREATALVVACDDARVSGFSAEDLCFAESAGDRRILKCGLAGPAVERGRTLLRASDTDWSLFNQAPEVAKCGAVVMYEQHEKPPGAALVEIPAGAGRIVVSSIDYGPHSERHARFWRDLLARLGVVMRAPEVKWILPIATVVEKGAIWRYTLRAPPEGWNRPGFADAAWQTGEAGFGTDVPGSRVRTPWTTSEIWLRREFDLPEGPGPDLALVLHHDEDVEVYVNGALIHRARGHVTAYGRIELTEQMRASFRRGANTVAVHCLQTAGGQYIDAGFVEDSGDSHRFPAGICR